MPASTKRASSRVFSPKPVNTASDPIAILTPAFTALRSVSALRWMYSVSRSVTAWS